MAEVVAGSPSLGQDEEETGRIMEVVNWEDLCIRSDAERACPGDRKAFSMIGSSSHPTSAPFCVSGHLSHICPAPEQECWQCFREVLTEVPGKQC